MSADDLKTTLAAVEMLCDEHPQQVVGIGEIGLDYYWKEVSPADQERAFIAQLDIARRRKLPVVIHCREAWPDTLSVIETHGDGVVGVFHCFGGTVDEAQRALDLGWYVSFAGNLTYPKAQDLRDAAAIVPLDRLLLETDSPFLAPQPKRGKRNEPVHSLHTADELARVHSTDRKTVLSATTANSRGLFRLE
jgi:TatD DNase family protein